MFSDEKAEWDRLFEFYAKKFQESVGIVFGAIATDELDVDLVIGEQSGKLRGVHVIQTVGGVADDEREGGEGGDEGDEGGDGEEGGDGMEMWAYDFVSNPAAQPVGAIAYKEAIAIPKVTEEEKKQLGKSILNVNIYTEDADIASEITCVTASLDGELDSHLVLAEDPDL